MRKRVELDNIGFNVGLDPVRQGIIELRYRKLTEDDDGKVIATEPHRATIDVDTNLDEYLEQVAADLERQGYGRPPETDRGYIDDVCNRAWTPEVRAAVKADREERARKVAEIEKAQKEQAELMVKQAEQQFDNQVAASMARREARGGNDNAKV